MAVDNGSIGLFLPPGAGKTIIILKWFETLSKLYNKKFKALVMAPKQIINNSWVDEMEKWGSHFKVRNIRQDGYHADANIYLTNPEKFRSDILKGETYFREFQNFTLDESTLVKNPFTKRTQAIHRMLDVCQIPHRAVMSGTAITARLLDIWGQIRIVDPHIFDDDFLWFRSRYFVPDVDGYNWELKDPINGAETILSQIRSKSFLLRPEDYHEVGYPEVVVQDIKFSLSPRDRHRYNKLHEDFLLEFREAVSGLKITFDITKYLDKLYKGCISYNYCSQFVSGFLYDSKTIGDGAEAKRLKETKYLHDSRYNAASDLLESLEGRPLLIFYQYTADGEMLKARFKKDGKKAEIIKGAMKDTTMRSFLKAWNRGELDALICQISVAARGLNMQAGGHHVLFYSIPDNFDLYKQSYHRLVRLGQRFQVTIYRLLCRGTIDHRRLQLLETKIKNFAQFEKIMTGEPNE